MAPLADTNEAAGRLDAQLAALIGSGDVDALVFVSADFKASGVVTA